MIETLVLIEEDKTGISPRTGELITAARNLGGRVGGVILSNDVKTLNDKFHKYGFDELFVVRHALLNQFSIDAHVIAFEQICRRLNPKIVLIGKTVYGVNVGPRVAFRLGTGIAQDCTGVDRDDQGRLIALRPVYGGSALAKVGFSGEGLSFVILRERVYDPIIGQNSLKPPKLVDIEVEINESDISVNHLERVFEETEGVKLEDASVVVAGGRGLGGPDPFSLLEELATILGGSVAASRAACDAGWVDHSYQVGLTGKTIAPNLYITVGISGASQHMAGCSGAKALVAIDRDGQANIFKDAKYGVVGEWQEVLPAFIEKIKNLV